MDQGKTIVEVCQAISNNELNAFEDIWKAAQFHHLHTACCDIDDFFIDLVTTPHSPWNQSAARVFTIHFIKKFNLAQNEKMVHFVQEKFFTRMKTMHAALRKLSAGKEAIARSQQATRRWLRKKTVRRLDGFTFLFI